MRVAAHHANGKVRGKTIVDTEGYAAGREIKPARVGSTVDVSEFTNSRDKYDPPVFRCRLYDGRAALAFWSSWPRKVRTNVMPPCIDREACLPEAGVSRAYVVLLLYQLHCVN